MVDGVATFDEVIKKMRRAAKPSSPQGASRLKQARDSLALL
jgi:hypothetical protein